jgi:hypothetical protein
VVGATVDAAEGFESFGEEYLDLEVGFLKVQLPFEQLKRLSEKRHFGALDAEKFEDIGATTLATNYGLVPSAELGGRFRYLSVVLGQTISGRTGVVQTQCHVGWVDY